jgi:hypothetical protein
MSGDGHHEGGGAHAPAPQAAPQPAAPAPLVVQPYAVAAPQVAAPQMIVPQMMAPGLCRCGLGSTVLVCACALKPEEKKADPHAGHKPAGPPPPSFSSAVPADFPPRFEYVWTALAKVLEGKAPPQGVIADARALLDMLLDDLDPEGRGRFVTEGVWWWKKTTYKTYSPKQRLHKLVEKRVLLKSVKDTVDRLAWTPEEQASRGVRGDPDLARRLVHLVWQVADQGFEQRSWSELAEAPPRVAPPAPAGGHDDHGHGGGHGDHH